MDTVEDFWNGLKWDGIRDIVPGYVGGAVVLLIVGWLIALIVSKVVSGALRRSGLDRRLGPYVSGREGGQADAAGQGGRLVFYLIMLFVLVAVFDALGLQLVTAPLTALLGRLFAFLPQLFAAVLILVVGWLLARIVGQLVTGFLAAVGVDRQAARLGVGEALGSQRLSGILGTIVYILILLPVIAAALDALGLEALTRPVSNMINQILAAIPNIVAAAIIIVVAYYVGRLLGSLVGNVLTGLGFNAVPARLGLAAPGPRPATGVGSAAAPAGRTPAHLVGTLVHIALVWFAVIQALEILGFDQLTVIMTGLIALAGRILLGLVIFAVGLYLARLAARSIHGSGVAQSNLLAFVGQAAILVLFGAMALQQMGVANEIINLAFGFLIGAIAVAAALAFGIGGRETAGRLLERWVTAARTGELDRAAREATESGPSAEIGTTGP